VILSSLSIGDVTWGDVMLPFESYAIRLPRPIKMHESGFTANFLMLTRTAQGVYIRAHGDKIAKYTSSEPDLKKDFESNFYNRNFETALELCHSEFVRFGKFNYGTTLVLPNTNFSDSVGKSLAKMGLHETISENSETRRLEVSETDTVYEGMMSAIRVLVGLALYMKTLKSPDSYISNWSKENKRGAPDPKAITNRTKICNVRHSYALSSNERIALGLDRASKDELASLELNWQFVSGYWRRLAGLGKDPNAPKTEIVRSYMRRKDRMPDVGLPGGSQQTF